MIALKRTISDLGEILSAIDVFRPANDGIIRDFGIDTEGVEHIQAILQMMQSQPGVEYISHSDRTFLIHLGGNRNSESCTDEDERRSFNGIHSGGC